jgi:hypothetical protein
MIGLALFLGASSAQAQIDSDPPLLQGQKSYHLYSIPGVFNDGTGVVFSCTNVSAASVIVGVEVFPRTGITSLNDASATSQIVPAGEGVIFTTQATSWFGFTVGPINLGVGTVYGGSARILATDRSKVICSALIVDPNELPPKSIASLTIVKKIKQKGD